MKFNELFREGASKIEELPVQLHLRVDEAKDLPELVHMVDLLETEPLSAKQLADLTSSDEALSQVRKKIFRDFPQEDLDPCVEPFFSCRNELLVEKGLILWGGRVIIPNAQGQLT